MAWGRADEAMTQADEQDLRYVLDREGVAELLRRVVELVAAETALPVARILLYGSRARGDWLPESDVDVALVLDLEPDADGWTAAERALWGLPRGLRDCPGSDLLTCTPVAAAALEDPRGEYADFHRNIVAEGIEWRAGAALPEAVPHDRDAPPPWPHLPPPDFYLDRAARFFERVDRVPVKLHGPADAEWLQMAAHDILRAALLATGTAPPRPSPATPKWSQLATRWRRRHGTRWRPISTSRRR